ncbi:hypothetical protein HPB52_018136 [Rhipicephalus sanguineus]|uniref:Uncharacterized protein n=1 Tax=Rhipicephalus sanguineus TaxID=34632 RepID=A0A9D4SR43_RHISA|nr:hypothetical protein HPB52_018136 [Rhipicephalus sanguineus]
MTVGSRRAHLWEHTAHWRRNLGALSRAKAPEYYADSQSSEEVPSEQEEPIEGWELLDAGCTAEDFCTADDNLATCGARTVEDIVEEATCEVADSSDDGDNIDEGDGEGPPPAAETLHALDVLRRAMAADEISDDTCTRFYGFQRSLLSDFAKKKKQKDIRDFFCKK